jgi:membrane-associated phospholipid phosphatase
MHEWLSPLFLALFVALAWLRPLTRRQRTAATVIGVCGIAAATLIPLAQQALFPQLGLVRDLLPAPLMILAYRQTGFLFGASNEKLRARLETLDRRLFGDISGPREGRRGSNLVTGYLEGTYLFCYLMIPLGVGVLYLLELQLYVRQYWMVVLSASYLCYVSTVFFQTMPPRVRLRDPYFGARPNKLRALNLFIVRTASIGWNSFPSAHVAGSVAAGLALLRFAPVAGMIFLWLSLSIAVGAVAGRYHYALDAFTGAALAATMFALVTCCYG